MTYLSVLVVELIVQASVLVLGVDGAELGQLGGALAAARARTDRVDAAGGVGDGARGSARRVGELDGAVHGGRGVEQAQDAAPEYEHSAL